MWLCKLFIFFFSQDESRLQFSAAVKYLASARGERAVMFCGFKLCNMTWSGLSTSAVNSFETHNSFFKSITNRTLSSLSIFAPMTCVRLAHAQSRGIEWWKMNDCCVYKIAWLSRHKCKLDSDCVYWAATTRLTPSQRPQFTLADKWSTRRNKTHPSSSHEYPRWTFTPCWCHPAWCPCCAEHWSDQRCDRDAGNGMKLSGVALVADLWPSAG